MTSTRSGRGRPFARSGARTPRAAAVHAAARRGLLAALVLAALVLALLAAAGCDADPDARPDGTPDAGGLLDGGAAGDSGGTDDGGAGGDAAGTRDTGGLRDAGGRPDVPRDGAPADGFAGDDAGAARDAAASDVDARGGDAAPADAVGDAVADVDEGDAVLFSFAVLADPHLDGTPGRSAFLGRAVDRLIAERDARRIELVFVLGDIAWGGTDERRHMVEARDILARLGDAGMHWVPVLGDNAVQAGCEVEFHEVFGAQYAHLAEVLEGWQKLPTPVDGVHLQSFSFEHRGCHFVAPDFISRTPGDEAADLHAVADGSWPWFRSDIDAAAHGPAERINVFTHHGMFQTGFASADRYLLSDEAMAELVALLCPYREHVAASYGGHIHQDWFWTVRCASGEPIYEVWSTDDAHDALVSPEARDDRVTIRVVEVRATVDGFTYEQRVLTEPTDE